MIKASELRIGNYILPLKETKEWVQVTGIYEDGTIDTTSFFYNGAGSAGTNSETAIPVTLTTEWLERLGFAPKSENIQGWQIALGQNLIMKDVLYISIAEKYAALLEFMEGNNTAHFIPNNPQSVHQLQNLYFVLTGEELALKETV